MEDLSRSAGHCPAFPRLSPAHDAEQCSALRARDGRLCGSAGDQRSPLRAQGRAFVRIGGRGKPLPYAVIASRARRAGRRI